MSVGTIKRLILHLTTASKPIAETESLSVLQFFGFFFRVIFLPIKKKCFWYLPLTLSIIRHMSLDSIDPSLAIGFYCRDKGLVLLD